MNSNGDHPASEVATVGRRRTSYRKAIITAVFFTGSSLSMSACLMIGTTATCSNSPGALITSSGSTHSNGPPSTTLPPSHDNDVGNARIPDRTPDADVDANQRYQICSGPH